MHIIQAQNGQNWLEVTRSEWQLDSFALEYLVDTRRRIGVGSFASVWWGQHKLTKIPVAIKVVGTNFPDIQKFRRRPSIGRS